LTPMALIIAAAVSLQWVTVTLAPLVSCRMKTCAPPQRRARLSIPRRGYLPPALASIIFWIFSRLNEPGD
jgi:hypothetical protein